MALCSNPAATKIFGVQLPASFSALQAYKGMIMSGLKTVNFTCREVPNGPPVTRSVQIQSAIEGNFLAAMDDVYKNHPEVAINKYIGGFCFRGMNSGKPNSNASIHSLGLAIDLNYNLNPLNSNMAESDTAYKMRSSGHPIVQAMIRNGFEWGGPWGNRDTMHFEFNGRGGTSAIGSFSGIYGESGGIGTFSGLNTETLAAMCPEDIEFKGMWMRYHLILGDRSPIIGQFTTESETGFAGGGGWSGSLAELQGSDVLQKACQLISREECGVDYSQPLDPKFLVGYQLEGESHKTYGWGQMYSADGQLMERIRPVWTEQQLRDDFERHVAQHIAAINATGINFTDNQKAVLSHRRHFGLKPFMEIIKKIKAAGYIPDANGYRDMALDYCRSCKNWNLYGRGWTNGINREASYWS